MKTHTRHKPHFPITSGVKVIVHWPLTLTSLLTTTKISLTLGRATAEDKRPLKKKKSKTRWIWRTSRVWNRFHKSTLYCEGYTQTKKKKLPLPWLMVIAMAFGIWQVTHTDGGHLAILLVHCGVLDLEQKPVICAASSGSASSGWKGVRMRVGVRTKLFPQQINVADVLTSSITRGWTHNDQKVTVVKS